ncbi:uncharacterized protein EI90DRAFT_3016671 [Cantharellus anzutake]|uniref:uncharacterized protein n=1 Tax=Cantharellus anzutake TaxID=1750568 RepID=UPI001904106F|nr:uncharacterized protein EI90DRAFT_3016671 [Cantharellus anzutake]KAF8330850.1 hypothetical protein EI90DRAFT_3016671 [Cantharellus anzutake]
MYNHTSTSVSLPQYDFLSYDLGAVNDLNDKRIPVPPRDRHGSPSSPALSDTDTFAGSGGASPSPSSVYSPPYPFTAVITPSSLDAPLPASPAIAGSHTENAGAWLYDVDGNSNAPALMPSSSAIMMTNFDDWYTTSVVPTTNKTQEDTYATVRPNFQHLSIGGNIAPVATGVLSALYSSAPPVSQASPSYTNSPLDHLAYPDASTWPAVTDLHSTQAISAGNPAQTFDPTDITSSYNPFSIPEFTFSAPVSEASQQPGVSQSPMNQPTQPQTLAQPSPFYPPTQTLQYYNNTFQKLSTAIGPMTYSEGVGTNYTQTPNQMSIAPALIDPSDAAQPNYGEWNQAEIDGVDEPPSAITAFSEHAVDSEEDYGEGEVEEEDENDDDDEWHPSPRSLTHPSSLPISHTIIASKNRRTASFSGTNGVATDMLTNDGSRTIRPRHRRPVTHAFVQSSGLELVTWPPPFRMGYPSCQRLVLSEVEDAKCPLSVYHPRFPGLRKMEQTTLRKSGKQLG